MCRQSSEKPIHITQLHNIILPPFPFLHKITWCSNPKASKRAWFYCQKQAHSPCVQPEGSSVPAGYREGCRRTDGKWQHLKLPCIKCKPHSRGCPQRRCVRQRLQSAWERAGGLGMGGGLPGCPAVPRERLAVPDYFLRLFMSTSHMPFCFRSTK